MLDEIQVDGGSGGVITANGYVGRSSATGTKTDTPFIETPQSISSVTEKQLDDRKPQSLLDAISYTPGVRVNAYGTDPRYDSFFVRGFNVTNTGVFRDNLRQPTAGYAIFSTEPYGIEGISILRGPSSALYGATGAGGLYNVITKRPTMTPLREVGIQYGTYDRRQAQFDLSGPVEGVDTLYYRLTGVGRVAGTEFKSVPDDRVYIAPALTWKPNEDTKLTILGEYSRAKTGGSPGYYNDYYGHVTRIESGDPAYGGMTHEQARIGWEFEHRINETFTVRQNARYSTQDIDAKYVYTYNGAQHALDPTLIDRGSGRDVQRLDAFVIDNQLQTKISTGPLDHTILTGVDITWTRFRASSGTGTAPPLSMLVPNYGGYIAPVALTSQANQRQMQTGVYVQDQIRLGGWTLTVGGRHDWVSTRTNTTDLTTAAMTSAQQDDRAFSGRVGLSYKTPFGLVPYVSFSTAFSPNIGWNKTTQSTFKSTTSVQQEVGVKYLLPDTNIMLTAALFNVDQKNGIFYEVINGINMQVQRGKLRSRGVELEAVASLDNGLSFTAAYTYTELKVVEGPSNTVGKYVSSVPLHTGSVWTNYKLPTDSVFHGLSAGVGARLTSFSYGDDKNSLKNSARAVFDAVLRFDFEAVTPQLKGVSLQVNATNLFNRRDTTCTSGYCYPDPGRTVMGSLKYTW
ncbi:MULTISPECIES: TonB-dependent siderophore receptor [unclassified Beijerinckia]|uniref:TonB-dependent siderophore receptor n=1 Tax=unclassified Beijerinckia TaxID=2638183 RepID=UPI00089CF5C6|nr:MULTISPECIES: TonB-dependent siderophore receptor [unclassified Beijerinckia]MDH7797106.1 iron complex outermembrane receptor protein [Beijerinckia sp. GAS462]SEC72460.1 iron complex outermembrane recepter protein [Beijerinckia sp. 28-YEA-48]